MYYYRKPYQYYLKHLNRNIICKLFNTKYKFSQNSTKSQILLVLENCIIVKHKDICRVVRLISDLNVLNSIDNVNCISH
jgi:hypothetical protein